MVPGLPRGTWLLMVSTSALLLVVAGWEAVRPLWWKLSDALFARDEPTPLPLLSVDLLPAAQPPAAAPEDTFHWQYRERPQGVDSRRQPNLVARLRRRRMAPQGQMLHGDAGRTSTPAESLDQPSESSNVHDTWVAAGPYPDAPMAPRLPTAPPEPPDAPPVEGEHEHGRWPPARRPLPSPSSQDVRGPDPLLHSHLEAIIPEAAEALPGEFLPAYKSPCWADATYNATRCLPYFYILGVFQCGTRDLYARVSGHKQVATGNTATSNFFFEKRPWGELMDSMARVMPAIHKAPATVVAGDASAGTFTFTWTHAERVHQEFATTMAYCWKTCQTLGDPAEKKRCVRGPDNPSSCYVTAQTADAAALDNMGGGITLPALVRALHGTRSARFVVLLRNPADRLWACFRFYPHYSLRYGEGVDGFQAWFEDQSGAFRKCEAEFNTRDCALYFESLGPDYEDVFYHADQLIKGMYSVFMADWLEAFPREAILVVRAEDYYADNKATLQTVLGHIGLEPLVTPEEWERVLRAPVQKPKRTAGGERLPAIMPVELRNQVEDFYAEFNGQLARQLGDDRFLWRR